MIVFVTLLIAALVAGLVWLLLSDRVATWVALMFAFLAYGLASLLLPLLWMTLGA